MFYDYLKGDSVKSSPEWNVLLLGLCISQDDTCAFEVVSIDRTKPLTLRMARIYIKKIFKTLDR